MEKKMERWLDVNGFDKYEISSNSRIRNKKTKKVLKNVPCGEGLFRVNLSRKEGSRNTVHLVRVHLLFEEHFGEKKKEVATPIQEIDEDRVLSNVDWDDERAELMDTEPNYKALMFCILHKVTADDALRQMGVYDRQRPPSDNAIEKNGYVSDKTRGRQTPDRDRTINVGVM